MKLYMFRAEELPDTCRVSCRNKFGKLVHLVGFIIKKRVFPFVPTFVSCSILFNITTVIYVLFPQRKSVTSAPKTLRCWGESRNHDSHNALMLSFALFFRYVTTAFVGDLLYYIECESWSFTLMGTRG